MSHDRNQIPQLSSTLQTLPLAQEFVSSPIPRSLDANYQHPQAKSTLHSPRRHWKTTTSRQLRLVYIFNSIRSRVQRHITHSKGINTSGNSLHKDPEILSSLY